MNQQAAMEVRLTEQQHKRMRALKRQQALRQAVMQRAGSSEAQQQLTDMEVELRNIHEANKTILHVRPELPCVAFYHQCMLSGSSAAHHVPEASIDERRPAAGMQSHI